MKTKQGIELKIALLRAGMSYRDLARKCGLSPITVTCIICASERNRGPWQRWRVEKAMAAPFWTAPEEFARRMGIIQAIGFDPWLSPRKVLISKCQRAGVIDKDASAAKGIGNEELIYLLAKHHGRAAA